MTVLSVSGMAEDHAALANVLAALHREESADYRWEVASTASVDSAMSLLENTPIPVVVCEGEPGRESWKALLERLPELDQPPLVIVGSRTADDALWAEALNLGAYDVLAKPLEPAEVMRALNLAWLRWKQANAELIAVPATHSSEERRTPASAKHDWIDVPDGMSSFVAAPGEEELNHWETAGANR